MIDDPHFEIVLRLDTPGVWKFEDAQDLAAKLLERLAGHATDIRGGVAVHHSVVEVSIIRKGEDHVR